MMVPNTSLMRSTVSRDAAEASITEFVNGVYRKQGTYIPGGRLQNVLARLIPANSRNVVRRVVTDMLAVRERRKAAALVRTSSGPIRLHLGCGELPRADWTNVDLMGVRVDIAWNLKRPLPFPDDSVDAIFHEHVLEHLPMDVGLAFTRECYRVLKQGGILRIAVPDAGRHIGWYCQNTLPEARQGYATNLMSVLQEFYGHGHLAMYDFDTLALLCQASGFETVERRAFGESRLDPCPDHEWRAWDSLYVETVK